MGEKYDFEGILLDELLLRMNRYGHEGKEPLYEEMCRLNYIESSAGLIIDLTSEESARKKSERLKDEMDKLRVELKTGPNSSIVNNLLRGSFEVEYPSEAVDYFMVWLEPLFRNNIQGIDKESFKQKFRKVLSLECVQDKLIEKRKRIVAKHNLNIKLVLNIIGLLSDKNLPNRKVVKSVGPTIKKELGFLWGERGAQSYHKYVSGYDNGRDGVLQDKMKKAIESLFKD